MSLLDQAKQMKAGGPPGVGAQSPDPSADPSASGGDDSTSGPPATDEALTALQDKITSSIPPEQQDALNRIVLAGKKVMYSPDTSTMLTQELQSDDSTDKKLAGGAAGLMTLLDRESEGKIPPELYIPAGALLLIDIAQFMVQSGDEVSMQDVRDGFDQMSALIQTNHGVAPDQVSQTVSGQSAPVDQSTQPAPVGDTQPPPDPAGMQ